MNSATPKNLIRQVASQGFRLTRQRRVLIETLQESGEHLDAAKLLELARERDPAIDRATVYRTLEILKKLRLIDELDLMHLNGEKHYFEPKRKRGHCHLACFRCGAILEYSSPGFEALKAEIARENSFQVEVVRLEVGGVCGRCRRGPTAP
ncbi:MAG TPA: Fur family transcriptional regulator [Terriglobia bacterium]|nr:Fur family transcriptional regulator [Terriglobia bacterium]